MTDVDDLRGWMQSARERMKEQPLGPRVDHVGIVERVGDGVALVKGLKGVRLDELLLFDNGSAAIALDVTEDTVGCVLVAGDDTVTAGMEVRGSSNVIRVPVGEGLLGRVVDPMGRPLDGREPIPHERTDPIEKPAPAIVDRDFVTQPLMTGTTVIDSMAPLGRGQRELIIGDRKTGKTAIAVDTIINQRNTDVICIYAAIGQKTTSVNQVIEAVRSHGPMERSIFVVGGAEALPGAQWIAPYAACTMAEYFRDRGKDVLIVFDDLTRHAILYRQLSLLLRKPPGREAYPGDIFYIHSRLLERAAKLSQDMGGGSLTALPIAETQSGNLSAYIPTNLISITDGQIYLEPKLFYEGQKPAMNVGLSVSRVGGKTQAPAMKDQAQTLRLEYAQFLELEVFARFGGMIDERTRKTVEHGKRIRAILSQPQYAPLPLAVQVALLLAVNRKRLDALPLDAVSQFKTQLPAWLQDQCPRVVHQVETEGKLEEESRDDMLAAIDSLITSIQPSAAEPPEGN